MQQLTYKEFTAQHDSHGLHLLDLRELDQRHQGNLPDTEIFPLSKLEHGNYPKKTARRHPHRQRRKPIHPPHPRPNLRHRPLQSLLLRRFPLGSADVFKKIAAGVANFRSHLTLGEDWKRTNPHTQPLSTPQTPPPTLQNFAFLRSNSRLHMRLLPLLCFSSRPSRLRVSQKGLRYIHKLVKPSLTTNNI